MAEISRKVRPERNSMIVTASVTKGKERKGRQFKVRPQQEGWWCGYVLHWYAN